MPAPRANPLLNVDLSKENLHNIPNQDLCICLDYCNRCNNDAYEAMRDDLFDELLARARANKITDVDYSFLDIKTEDYSNGRLHAYVELSKATKQ